MYEPICKNEIGEIVPCSIISSTEMMDVLDDYCGLECNEHEYDEAFSATYPRSKKSHFTENDIEFLRQVYYFSKKRNWRYGLNIRYIRVRNREHIFNKLYRKGVIYTINWRGNTYVFIKKDWRRKIAELVGDNI